MDDRELLELAAKAVSLAYFDIDEAGVIEYGADTSSGFRHWNPLTDDGDALLAQSKKVRDMKVWMSALNDMEVYATLNNWRWAGIGERVAR